MEKDMKKNKKTPKKKGQKKFYKVKKCMCTNKFSYRLGRLFSTIGAGRTVLDADRVTAHLALGAFLRSEVVGIVIQPT